MDWPAIIDAAHAANERHGKAIKGGKKYTEVSTRVELFRRHFGAWGLATEIKQLGMQRGEWVVMRATISDEAGRVVATGTAHEVVGDGNVNRTSALENCETSAIGRALAALGIHGGEMASLNEMDAVQRNDPESNPPPAKKEKPPREIADWLLRHVATADTHEDLIALVESEIFQRGFGKLPPPMQSEVNTAASDREKSLAEVHEMTRMMGA